MVKFWVGFSLILATIVTLSQCNSQVSGNPFSFDFSHGSGRGERGSGVARTDARSVGEFSAIHAEGVLTLDVDVRSGQPGRSVEVTTDDNLLGQVTTEVRGGILEISALGGLRPSSDLRLKVSVPALAAIHLDGANRLNLNIDSAADFELHIEGAGKVKAAGKVGRLTMRSEGASSIDAAELVAGAVDVRIEGAGKAKVNATESLKARIEGAGVITYTGAPKTVEKNVEGVGTIKSVG